MKDDQHYHYFHPSVDEYLANRVHGYVGPDTPPATPSASDDSDVSARRNQSTADCVDEAPASFMALSINDLIQHLSNCFSEMLTFFICILILKRWLCVDLWPWNRAGGAQVPSPNTDAFLERRSFDPSDTNCDTRLASQPEHIRDDDSDSDNDSDPATLDTLASLPVTPVPGIPPEDEEEIKMD